MLTDGTGDSAHVLQIGGTVLVGRGADGDKLEQPMRDAFREIGRELQSSAFAVAPNHFIKAGFVDRDFATLQHLYLARVHVHAQHIVAHFGEAGAGDQPHIAGTKNRDFHHCPLNEYPRRTPELPLKVF